MKVIKSHWHDLVLLIVVAIAIIARVYLYGDLRLSVANAETYSYIKSSTAPFFSWESFAGKRLFTTNVIYKVALDDKDCKLLNVSYPAGQDHKDRTIQPCFDIVVLIQSLLSTVGWCFLAWTTSRRLTNPAIKIATTCLILAFAFTPQIAEWDSVLSPESLSLSLFVITFALLQEIVFQITRNNLSLHSGTSVVLLSGCMLFFILLVFVRDVHLYSILITIILLAVLQLHSGIRKSKIVVVIIGLLIGIYFLGETSAKAGLRAHIPLTHSFSEYILPYPARVDFFGTFGMPDIRSPAYNSWFDSRATTAYGIFLLLHPGFVAATIWDHILNFRTNFGQPYFLTKQNTLLIMGETVHPETLAIYLLDPLFLILLSYRAYITRDKAVLGWAWLAAWFFFSSIVTLLVSFFGDTAGVLRHIFPSVELLRLFFWIFLFVLTDEFLTRPNNQLDNP